MTKDDAPAFEALVSELAECFDRHVPSEGAMRHWYRALQYFPLEQVRKAVTDWIEGKPKFPSISEISQACIEQGSRARADEKRKLDQSGISWVNKSAEVHKVTPIGERCIAEIREMLRMPKRPNRDWAYRIMNNPKSTESQREFARPVVEENAREPGEDDE